MTKHDNYTNIQGFDKDNNPVAWYRSNCLATYFSHLNEHPSIVKGFYEYENNSILTEKQQAIYLEAWASLWHFGDTLIEPEQIVKDKGIMFDYETMTGFQIFPIYSLIRWMEESIYAPFNKLDMDALEKALGNQNEVGKILTNWIYDNSITNNHSFFPNHWNFDVKDYKFSKLKAIPEQLPLRQHNHWNHIKTGEMFHCTTYFKPENME